MARVNLIRRIRVVVRRHLWDGVCMMLFSAALISGSGPLVSGAGKFLDSLTPAMAQAADEPARADASVARLPMVEFAATSSYSPQVLFPVKSHDFPAWLT